MNTIDFMTKILHQFNDAEKKKRVTGGIYEELLCS